MGKGCESAGVRQTPIAARELLPQVYTELQRLAASKMANEAPGHTLQPTALVHEAWLRMQKQRQCDFESRTSFIKAAAETMRRILIDRARSKRAAKRSGDAVPLCDDWSDAVEFETLKVKAPDDEILAVDEALEKLSHLDPVSADLIKLRYFVGMTMKEVAEILEMPLRSAERRWTFCRAWLRRAIHEAR